MFNILKFVFNSKYRQYILAYRLHFYDNLDDITYIKKMYKIRVGKDLDLYNVKTFNEKLNWLKCYDKNPLYTLMADKYEAKKIVSEKYSNDLVIPTIGIYDSFDEIDFGSLPNEFVIKTTHNSGCLFVCKDKNNIDKNKIKKKINKSLKQNYFYVNREWPYKNIKPRIIVEKLITDGSKINLPVYKFFCFNGKVELCQSIQNDKTKYESIDYFDTNWNLLNLKQNFNNSLKPYPKPSKLSQMLEIASKLSIGFPFLRIDLYQANDMVYFSEFTFYSDAGFAKFEPLEWDNKLGELIDLSIVKGKCD